MNVLILTPDAVGSTLLQRLITIYMQFYEYDKPVINLHELTNGLEKYYSTDFNREIVSKKRVTNWGYYQTLEQITDLLSSVDHYKTSRLAQYHIKNRGDTLAQQIPFYRYLDDNFYVISCRRHNIFEHALSMALSQVTKKLNVYSAHDKLDTFANIYQDKIELDQRSLTYILDDYRDYLSWTRDYFNVASYFYYDENLDHIEKYILDLPIFPGAQPRVTWNQKFGIDFNDWNRCHHVTSDVGSLLLGQVDAPSPAQIASDTELEPAVSRALLHVQQKAIIANSQNHQEFYQKLGGAYMQALNALVKMCHLDIITSTPPVKKQTLAEKRYMVKNFAQCMDTYNDWVDRNDDVGGYIDNAEIEKQIEKETEFWIKARQVTIAAGSDPPPTLTS